MSTTQSTYQLNRPKRLDTTNFNGFHWPNPSSNSPLHLSPHLHEFEFDPIDTMMFPKHLELASPLSGDTKVPSFSTFMSGGHTSLQRQASWLGVVGADNTEAMFDTFFGDLGTIEVKAEPHGVVQHKRKIDISQTFDSTLPLKKRQKGVEDTIISSNLSHIQQRATQQQRLEKKKIKQEQATPKQTTGRTSKRKSNISTRRRQSRSQVSIPQEISATQTVEKSVELLGQICKLFSMTQPKKQIWYEKLLIRKAKRFGLDYEKLKQQAKQQQTTKESNDQPLTVRRAGMNNASQFDEICTTPEQTEQTRYMNTVPNCEVKRKPVCNDVDLKYVNTELDMLSHMNAVALQYTNCLKATTRSGWQAPRDRRAKPISQK